ncbi:paramecium surface antigen repeat-containing protein [Cavenderia fasciculata]|uniref:Paramecium surface antigen repeat-containing protein n=1 Tax=Cavenderia fasciculata TaxID=261658 RepID=F4PIB1_CACFS|nr:paramecium surface antigen repeat-containing protein [Cavenderia fasciculata]EGG24545.1 paramecium surface antigen repeat-containing protein [Cavenderia fasciculata]|eukprot:XP_004362396.1 paramecium surface antigen repeat-containing protein [Cavenderia fasciculata]
MKYITILFIIFILLIFTLIVQSEQCLDTYDNIVCVEVGQSCGINSTTGIESTCTRGQFCNSDGKCQVLIGKGGDCQNSTQCNGGYVCSNSVCGQLQYAQLGQSCETSQDCLSPLACTNKVCVSNNTGTTVCSSDIECSFTQYCNVSSCTDRTSVGSVCTTDQQCPMYHYCISTDINNNTAICQKAYTGQLNTPCNIDNNCDYSKGLICQPGSQINTCQYQPGYKQSTIYDGNCNGTSETVCNAGCFCSSEGNGECIISEPTTVDQVEQCGDAQKSLYDCYIEHQCYQNTKNYQPSSCQVEKCSSQLCNSLTKCTPYLSQIEQVKSAWLVGLNNQYNNSSTYYYKQRVDLLYFSQRDIGINDNSNNSIVDQ